MLVYHKDDYIMVVHPDYPELKGLARITTNRSTSIVSIEFCDGRGGFLAHTDYIRPATEQEIEENLNTNQGSGKNEEISD